MFKRHVDNAKSIVFLLALRYFLLILTLKIASVLITFSDPFTYKLIPEAQNLPSYIGSFANFDGEHYIKIAREGYHDVVRVFFPLYPMLIRFISKTTSLDIFAAGYVLSQVMLFAALVVIGKLFREIYKIKNANWIIVFMLAYPTAFFYSAVYSESLFLLLLSLSLYFFYRNKHMFYIVSAFLLALTRLQGIFLVLPIFFTKFDFRSRIGTSVPSAVKRAHIFLLAPVSGLAAYMLFLQVKVGDPLYFFHAQPLFGAQRSVDLVLLPQVYYRYMRIVLTADITIQYFVALVELVMFTFAFILCLIHLYNSVKKNRGNYVGVALFSLSAILLPTLTGTFSSIPRYSLFAWSIYFVLSELNLKARIVILACFIIMQAVLLSLFAQGYFVG